MTSKGEILPNPDANKYSLIVCSTGTCGTIKFWNTETSLIKKSGKHKPLTTKGRYARPPTLDVEMLPLQKLYRKWRALFTVIILCLLIIKFCNL